MGRYERWSVVVMFVVVIAIVAVLVVQHLHGGCDPGVKPSGWSLSQWHQAIARFCQGR